MLQWDATHPLVQELDHLGVAASAAEALRLPLDADGATVTDAARQACVRSNVNA